MGVRGANCSTASAFIADVSTDENRAKNFGFGAGEFGPRAWFTGPCAPITFAGARLPWIGVFLALSLLVLVLTVERPSTMQEHTATTPA
ncbi:hypothetical protein [Aminobacter sp. AP02]|uniref:hypothetical protein n=1 Tax=Aminobacter sp. AP02 TaxID=2135737 RepID=UPI000D6CA44E|nr:hypothetical protein [Aminobacter sp. AP02]